MKIIRDLQKHKYIRIERYTKTKGLEVRYYKEAQLPKDVLIDPDHVFNFRGYRSIMVSDNSAQTINPLDVTSQFPKGEFEKAINSKVVSELLSTTKKDKLDLTQMLLIGIAFIGAVTLYLLWQHTGGIKF